MNSIFSPLYLFELVYLIGFQLKLWYFVGAMTDFLGRLTLNNKTLSKSIKYISIVFDKCGRVLIKFSCRTSCQTIRNISISVYLTILSTILAIILRPTLFLLKQCCYLWLLFSLNTDFGGRGYFGYSLEKAEISFGQDLGSK